MKVEDIKDQAQLEALLEKAATEAVTKLADKNAELLGKLRQAKDNAAPDNLEDLRKAAADLKALKEGQLAEQGEYKKLLEKTKEQHAASEKALTDKLKAEQETVHGLLVDQGLQRALGSHNVNPVLLDSAVNLLSGAVSVVEEDGKKIARVGEKTLDIYVQDWVNSDVGKNFTLATSNSGGGAGGNGNASSSSEFEKYFQPETWNLTEQAKLSKTDPTLYMQLHEKHPTRNAGGQQQT